MRRNALLLAFLFVVGLAICWPPSWTKGILPTVGSKEGRAALSANLATPRSHDGILLGGASHSPDTRTAAGRNRIAQDYGKLPLSFEPNAGQTDGDVRFLSRGPGYTLFLTGDQAVLRLKSNSSIPSRQAPVTRALLQRGGSRKGQSTLSEPQKQADAVLSMQLVGANPKVTTRGADELPGKANYFIGSDPQKWRTHMPTYARVKYSNVYPGVDLVYYGNQTGQLEYDFVVAPGADPSAIVLSVAPGVQEEGQNSKIGNRRSAGKTALRIAPDGDLIVHLRDGDVRLHKPVVYQAGNAALSILQKLNAKSGLGAALSGSRTMVESHYVLTATNQVRFVLGPYDHTKPLCIDPILYYSTYMGGAVSDTGYGIAVDSKGNAYIAGATSSPSFPNATDSLNGTAQDAFITELNPTGTAVVYYTYLGGTVADAAYGIAVDSMGNAYVTGLTYSGDFPTVNPLSGSVCNNPPAGYTGPTGPNSYAASYGTGFVAELPAGGASLVFSTYLGGSKGSGGVAGVTAVAGDIARGIAVDPTCTSSSCVDVAGTTWSADFPVTSASNAYETYPLADAQAAFVTKLNWNGSTLTTPYSTLLGGISSGDIDAGNAIAVDSSGHIYVAGQTHSPDFPALNSLPSTDYGSTSSGEYVHNWGNAFVTELAPGTSSLLFSTFLGGNTGFGDSGNGIAVDPKGNIYVAGLTYSEDFPHPNALPGTTPTGTNNTYADTQPCDTCSPYGTGFVAEINRAATPAALAYSTYLGGSSGTGDSAHAIAVDGNENAYVVGTTRSANFPTVQNVTYSNGNFFNNSSLPGNSATFASEISAKGAGLLVSTYLGGSGSDVGNAVAIDSSGDMFLTGSTSSTNFPTAAPYLPPTNQQDLPYQGTLLASGTQPNAFVAMIQASAFADLTLSASGAASCTLNNLGTSSCTFTATTVGQSSADSPQVITVTNTGNAPATFNSITIIPSVSGSTDFALYPAGTCPTGDSIFAVGASCTVSITFAPAAPVQNETATLQIDYNNVGVSNAGGVDPVQNVNLLGSVSPLLGTGITTTTAVASSLNPSTYGSSVYFTATVTYTGLPVPGGTVQFTVGGVNLGSAVNLSGGAATSPSTTSLSLGSHTVTAAYSGYTAGSSTYKSSSSSLTQTVNTASLTITANNDSKTYGQTKSYGAGSTAFTSSGLQNGESIGSVTITASGGTAANAAVGSYNLMPSAATGGTFTASNYTITYNNGTLTVNPAAVTVAPNAGQSKVYGNTDPTLAYSITSGSLVNGDTFSGALSRAPGENVGNYAITQGTLALSANYALTFTTGVTFAITARPITVTANTQTKGYGAADPALSYQVTSGSPASGDSFTGALSRAPGENAGTYAITQGTLSITNIGDYNLTYVGANLTITAAGITVTANPQTKVYGAADPVLTYQVTSGSLASGDSFTGALTRAAGQNVGTFAITQGTLSVTNIGNYNLTYVGANLTITAATLTITASSSTTPYGSAIPTPTPSYSGFVNGDTSASLSPGPSCATTGVPAGNPAGTYTNANNCSGAMDSNYNIGYVAGTVIVSQAAPTVAAVGGTFAYNGNPEAASATAFGIDNVTPVLGIFAFTYIGTGSTNYGPLSTPPTNVGTYSVAVLFSSTNTNYTNGSASTTIVITPATASVVVASSLNPSTFGGSVYFTATVSSAAGTPTGTVQFVIDGVNFGSLVSLSGATATSPTTTTLTPGEHVVAAVYSGDNNFQTSTSLFLIQVVNNPLVSIAVTPVNPSIFVSGTQQFVATGTFTDTSSAILPTGGTWAMGKTMTNGVRAPMAAAGSTGVLYYFGGQDAGGAEKNYVQTYNPATGAWGSGANMTTARYQGVAVAPGSGLIYVIGGWNNGTPTNVVEAYDPAGNTWTTEASLGHLSGCSVGGAINGLIYVLTGCDGNSAFSNEFDVYNPATNTWTSLSSPAHAHNSGAGGVIGGKFYVAGGYDVTTEATGITELYDPQTSTWTTVSPMTPQLAELGGAVFGGNLYVVGGLDNTSTAQPDVYVYTPQSDTWSTLSSTLSAGRSNIGVVAFDGLIYAAGGSTSSPSNALEVLDTDDVTWSSDTAAVATVDMNAGLATGVTAGTANITAASTVYSPVSGSTLLAVNKQNQTINFGLLANQTYGNAPFSVSATATSGLPVSFASTTTSVCTTSGTYGSTVTMLATGTCSITASQAGNSSYNAAPDVSQSFMVNPATLTITASSGTMTYGGTPPSVTPSYSALAGSDTVASLTTAPTCTTTATSSTPVGTDTGANTCAGAVDGNYTITYVPGNVTVGKASLTITASSGTMTYGGTPPIVTPSYSGFVNGETAASPTIAPTCMTTVTSSTPVGTDTGADTCSGAVDTNYTIGYVAGNVVVSPAPLTITANNQSISAGAALPTFTTTDTGFKNGDTASSLTGTVVCSVPSITNTNTAGTYSIVCSGATDANYVITYVNGTLTITGSVSQGTPIASVSPGCVSFGNVLVGTNCTNQPVTLTNIGTASLTIAGITITGPQAADFSETNTCGTTLAAGASCTISVGFKPSTVGPETATLVITDNSNWVTGSTQTVGLIGAGVSQIQCNFNGTSISSGNYIWFNSVFSPKNIPNSGSVTYSVSNAQVTFTAGGSNYTVPLPNSIITLSSSVTVATTTFDTANNRWITLAPLTGLAGNIFLNAGAFPVPATGLPGGIQNVNWQASFATDTAGAGLNWQWGAAVYNNFTTNYNQLCVKPVDDTTHCQYQNSDHAGTCEGNNPNNQSWKGCVTGGATGGGGSNCTGSYSGTGSCNPPAGPVTVVNCTTLGTTAVGSTTTPVPVTITNNSSTTVTGITFSTTGPYAVSSTTCGTSLAAGATCTVYVTFTPTAAGTQTGTLKITDSASNSPQTVNLTGNLTSTLITNPGPVASVSPTCLAFSGFTKGDCQQWGSQPAAPQTVTLSNTGNGVLNIASVQITGTQASDFSFVNNCPSNLAAGAQCTISVSFNPQTVGPAQASLVITDNSNDVNGSTQTVSLNGAGLTQLQSNFNENWIAGVNYVWFSGSMTPQNINPNATTNFFMTNGTVTFTENKQNYSVSIPDCIVTFAPNVTTATTSFDTVNNRWVTVAPTWGLNGNTFLSAVAYQVPNEGLPGSISNVVWTGAFSTDTPGASLIWQWAAAPYDTLPTNTDANNNQSCDYNASNVKPVDGNQYNNWNDNENAGTPEGWQSHVHAGATCDGVSNHTGNYCNPGGATCKLGPVYTPTCSTAPPTTVGQTCPPVPIKVCNKGSQPLCITNVKCTGDFKVCNNVSGTTLQPGQSCTINVSFCPSQKGTRCGTLQVTDNSTNSPHTVCLTGNGQ